MDAWWCIGRKNHLCETYFHRFRQQAFTDLLFRVQAVNTEGTDLAFKNKAGAQLTFNHTQTPLLSLVVVMSDCLVRIQPGNSRIWYNNPDRIHTSDKLTRLVFFGRAADSEDTAFKFSAPIRARASQSLLATLLSRLTVGHACDLRLVIGPYTYPKLHNDTGARLFHIFIASGPKHKWKRFTGETMWEVESTRQRWLVKSPWIHVPAKLRTTKKRPTKAA